MHNLILFWSSSYQIPKSLFSEYTMCGGDSCPLSMKWRSCYLQNVFVKKNQRTFLPLWSVHMCAVLPDYWHWPFWRLAWNNWQLLTQASLLNSARRLDHCDVIVSLAPRWHSKPSVIYGSSFGPNTSRVLHMVWKHGYQTQQVSLCPKFSTIRAIAVI